MDKRFAIKTFMMTMTMVIGVAVCGFAQSNQHQTTEDGNVTKVTRDKELDNQDNLKVKTNHKDLSSNEKRKNIEIQPVREVTIVQKPKQESYRTDDEGNRIFPNDDKIKNSSEKTTSEKDK